MKNTQLKALYLLSLIGFAACNQGKEFDTRYNYILGKWIIVNQDGSYGHELWIDKKYIFYGSDDFPELSEYEVINDSIYVVFNWMNETSNAGQVPALITEDTLQRGDTKYYRIVSGVPEIDTSRTWRINALTEIVLRRQAFR